MPFLKFSLILVFISFAQAYAFDSNECLDSQYGSYVKHKGALFGLISHELKINKEGCVMTFSYKTLLEKTWKIDVCREPVHIKVESNGGVEVFKREKSCDLVTEESEYCNELNELKNILQDHGLIFAEGDRGSLTSEHGKVYCSYLLIKKYLVSGQVFGNKKIDIFEESKNDDGCVIEKKSQGIRPKAEKKIEEKGEVKAPKKEASKVKEEPKEATGSF